MLWENLLWCLILTPTLHLSLLSQEAAEEANVADKAAAEEANVADKVGAGGDMVQNVGLKYNFSPLVHMFNVQ